MRTALESTITQSSLLKNALKASTTNLNLIHIDYKTLISNACIECDCNIAPIGSQVCTINNCSNSSCFMLSKNYPRIQKGPV